MPLRHMLKRATIMPKLKGGCLLMILFLGYPVKAKKQLLTLFEIIIANNKQKGVIT